jgi:hypothetical protein
MRYEAVMFNLNGLAYVIILIRLVFVLFNASFFTAVCFFMIQGVVIGS